jgi:hypothetical protein
VLVDAIAGRSAAYGATRSPWNGSAIGSPTPSIPDAHAIDGLVGVGTDGRSRLDAADTARTLLEL